MTKKQSHDNIKQEGWLSPTERASVSAISLRHNLATSGESRWYVVAFTRFFSGGGNRLPQESLKRHILASPGYATGTIAVNVTWMERGFNAYQTHRCMYLSIFNRLRAIARYWSEIATFSYPLAFNAAVGGVVIGIPGKRLVLIKLESWGYQAVKTV